MLNGAAARASSRRAFAERTSSAQTVTIVLEGADTVALRELGDALVPELRALGPDDVASAEDGIRAARAFLQPRAGLFAKLDDLKQLQKDVEARWDWEVAHATGAAFGDATGAAVLALWRDLRSQVEAQAAELRQLRKESHALKCAVRKGFAAL